MALGRNYVSSYVCVCLYSADFFTLTEVKVKYYPHNNNYKDVCM